ncbi:hypothetical protein NOC27_3025 [Nitrosococcus oceani AFC27]|nr:hypothetical protein NOC27_3025 [Nitrosococcus oceani AFC27]
MRTAIGRITPEAGFLSVQQAAENGRVVDIGRRGDNAANQAGATVNTSARLHPEIPLVAPLPVECISGSRCFSSPW